jgi:thiamine-phosphate pyrophosphorylase
MPLDVRLLAIVGPPSLSESRVIPGCLAAAAGGATAIQIRFKTVSASTLLHLTEALLEVVPVPVYVNDRADVALVSGAHGVHLGADDVPPAAVRRFAPHPFRIGVSVGSPEEAHAVQGTDVDYWSVGSIYATSTKPDAGSPIGIDGFRRLAVHAPPDVPVIAIGGIAASNAAEILNAGAAGIAVGSGIFGAPDIEVAARGLRNIINATVGS